jgi:hypothetical protein
VGYLYLLYERPGRLRRGQLWHGRVGWQVVNRTHAPAKTKRAKRKRNKKGVRKLEPASYYISH